MTDKHCKFCNTILLRRVNKAGIREDKAQYERRTYCNRQCKSDEYEVTRKTKGLPYEQMDTVPFPEMARRAWR